MPMATLKIETIRNLAQDIVDEAEELLAIRDDKDANSDDKADAYSTFVSSIVVFESALPKNLQE